MRILAILLFAGLVACNGRADIQEGSTEESAVQEQAETSSAESAEEPAGEVTFAEEFDMGADHVHTEACNSGTHNCGDHCGCGDGCKCTSGAACSEKCEPKRTM